MNQVNNGCFVISLDFEKYWGVRDHKTINDYSGNLKLVDTVCNKTLDLFNKYNIQATWAIVGFLMFKNKEELTEFKPNSKPRYDEKSLDPYSYIENNKLDGIYHFSNDIICKIAENKNQELASHTFSHYYCLEKGQDINTFKSDTQIFIEALKKKYCMEVSSIVFPRNQVNKEYLTTLKTYGISAYRGNERSWLYQKNFNLKLVRGLRLLDNYINLTGSNTYKIDQNNDILDIPSSRFLRPYSKRFSFLEKIRLRRIKKQMYYAAKNHEVFHLWWHPHNFGSNMNNNFNFLEEILKYYAFLKTKFNFQSINMKNYYEQTKE